MSATQERAAAAVDAIIQDLRGRSGLDNEWDGIDEDTRAEIRQSWISLAVGAMQSPLVETRWNRIANI